MSDTPFVSTAPESNFPFSPSGRSAERSEAMRGPLALALTPSSGATRNLLPAGEKRGRRRFAAYVIRYLSSAQEAHHAPRF
jgi:hypothetical protein